MEVTLEPKFGWFVNWEGHIWVSYQESRFWAPTRQSSLLVNRCFEPVFLTGALISCYLLGV